MRWSSFVRQSNGRKLFETTDALLKWQWQLVCYESQNTQLNRKS